MMGDTHYVMFGYQSIDGFEQMSVLRITDRGFAVEGDNTGGLRIGYVFGRLENYQSEFRTMHEEVIVESHDSISGIHDPLEAYRLMIERGHGNQIAAIHEKFQADNGGIIRDKVLREATGSIVMQAHDEEMKTQRVYRMRIHK